MWPGMGSTPLNAEWVGIYAAGLLQLNSVLPLSASRTKQQPPCWDVGAGDGGHVFGHDAVPHGLQLGVQHLELW